MVEPSLRWSSGPLPAGRYRVSFRSGRSVEFWPDTPSRRLARLVTVAPGRRVALPVVHLRPTGITGRLTTSSGGAASWRSPVLIDRRTPRGWRLAQTAYTDGSGDFVASGLSPGTYRVWFERRAGGTNVSPLVRVRHESLTTVNGRIRTPGGLAALLVDEDGRPVEGATVYAYYPRGGVWTQFGFPRLTPPRTDASGVATYDLPAGYYRIGFGLPGSGGPAVFAGGASDVERAADVLVRPGRTARTGAVAPPTGSLSGRVTDTSGEPVQHAFVSVGGGAVTSTTQTAADGTYSFSLPARSYEVRFSAGVLLPEAYPDVQGAGAPTGYAHGEAVRVAPGASVVGVDAVLATESVLQGRITGPLGAPLTVARVMVERRMDGEWVGVRHLSSDGLDPRSGPIDDNGRFTVTGLAKGAYRVTAEALLADGRGVGMQDRDGHDVITELSIGEEETRSVDVVVDPTGVVTGNVIGSSGAGVRIVVERDAGELWETVTTLDRDGTSLYGQTYSTPHLPPGRYRLRFRDPQRIETVREVEVGPVGTVGLDVPLLGGSITGWVEEPPRRGVVSAVRSDGTVVASTSTAGEFVLAPLPADDYYLRVRDLSGALPDAYLREQGSTGPPLLLTVQDSTTRTVRWWPYGGEE